MMTCLNGGDFLLASARSWFSPGRSSPAPLMPSSLRTKMQVSASSCAYLVQFRTWSSMLRGSWFLVENRA